MPVSERFAATIGGDCALLVSCRRKHGKVYPCDGAALIRGAGSVSPQKTYEMCRDDWGCIDVPELEKALQEVQKNNIEQKDENS